MFAHLSGVHSWTRRAASDDTQGVRERLSRARVAAAAWRALEVRADGLGSPQFAHDRSRAVAVPVLVERVSVGLEVANENVLGANGDVLVAAGALVQLARNAEGQNDDIVVEVHSPQALLSTRQTGVGHRGSLSGVNARRADTEPFPRRGAAELHRSPDDGLR